jgi:hypothetical protein
MAAAPRKLRAVRVGPGARRALRAVSEGPDGPRTLRAVRVGPGARRALRAGARGTVELAFGPGGYLLLGEQHVLLAPARSPLGPLSVLVAGLARGDLVPGDPAEVAADGTLAIGSSLRIDLSAARPAAQPRAPGEPAWPPPGPARQAREPAQARAALDAALATVAPAPAELAPGLAALTAGDLPAAVAWLAGRGDGLTPAGDDVLAGFAAWRWAAGEPVVLDAERCAPLGRAYLRCAERGELPQPAAAVLAAIRAGDSRAAARRARGLAAWGASSGAALLWGLAAGVMHRPGRLEPPPAARLDPRAVKTPRCLGARGRG